MGRRQNDQDIVPITIKSRKGDFVFDHDETYIKDAKLENFAKMKPVFKPDGGTVTVGNASPINDGSAVFLMMSADKAKELGYKPIANMLHRHQQLFILQSWVMHQ